MARYPRLQTLMLNFGDDADTAFQQRIVPYLIEVWLEHYTQAGSESRVVETTVEHFSYLFDVQAERLIAAWGVSRGRHSAERDKARMAGHPLSAGQHYHRGHAIPHSLGGPTDINLVAQRGSLNLGAFRRLEKRAVVSPGALYFTSWTYGKNSGQTPEFVDQGLLVPGSVPELRTFQN